MSVSKEREHTLWKLLDEMRGIGHLSFLKAGDSLYSLDALKLAGVDMTTPEAVETTFGVLAGYVDRLEALLGT